MKFNNYLKQPLVQKTVMEFAQEIHPLIDETTENLEDFEFLQDTNFTTKH